MNDMLKFLSTVDFNLAFDASQCTQMNINNPEIIAALEKLAYPDKSPEQITEALKNTILEQIDTNQQDTPKTTPKPETQPRMLKIYD